MKSIQSNIRNLLVFSLGEFYYLFVVMCSRVIIEFRLICRLVTFQVAMLLSKLILLDLPRNDETFLSLHPQHTDASTLHHLFVLNCIFFSDQPMYPTKNANIRFTANRVSNQIFMTSSNSVDVVIYFVGKRSLEYLGKQWIQIQYTSGVRQEDTGNRVQYTCQVKMFD